MSCKHNINLVDLWSLENELDSLLELHDVENAKDNINSCVSKATYIIMYNKARNVYRNTLLDSDKIIWESCKECV